MHEHNKFIQIEGMQWAYMVSVFVEQFYSNRPNKPAICVKLNNPAKKINYFEIFHDGFVFTIAIFN